MFAHLQKLHLTTMNCSSQSDQCVVLLPPTATGPWNVQSVERLVGIRFEQRVRGQDANYGDVLAHSVRTCVHVFSDWWAQWNKFFSHCSKSLLSLRLESASFQRPWTQINRWGKHLVKHSFYPDECPRKKNLLNVICNKVRKCKSQRLKQWVLASQCKKLIQTKSTYLCCLDWMETQMGTFSSLV